MGTTGTGIFSEDFGHLERFVAGHLARVPGSRVDDLVAMARRQFPLVDAGTLSDWVERCAGRASGLGIITELFGDPGVTEVMINGPGPVWVDRAGVPEPTTTTLGRSDIDVLVERILDPLGLRVDPTCPFVDARLGDGSRVNVIVPPVAIDGPIVTIRRFGSHDIALERFGPPDLVALLRAIVAARLTVLVIGSTGAGKTTLLNALASSIPTPTRIITIEDTAELRLPGDHVVRLEARPPNREGIGEVTIRQLVRNALRMRPDRLIVGEVRGGEALDLLLALNTGHEGSMTTCHANDPVAGLRRLETLALLADIDVPLPAVRPQLLGAIDVVIEVGWRRGARVVVSVAEVGLADLDVRPVWPERSGEPLRRRAVGVL